MVTGSRGFIGRHLVSRLRHLDWRVEEWTEDVRSLGGYDEPADAVFHLAATVRQDTFAADPGEGLDVNVTGTLAAVNYCHKVGATCVVTSTSGVYQPTGADVLISEESATAPTRPYTISKWLAENISRRQSADLDIPCTVLRIFNVYGPGQHPSFLVPYVVDRLRMGLPVSLRTPEAHRDFIYIEDVVDSLLLAFERGSSGFRLVNVGTGQATRIIDLVRTAKDVFGVRAAVDTSRSPETGPSAVIADTTRARDELGFEARYTLKDGLNAIRDTLDPQPPIPAEVRGS